MKRTYERILCMCIGACIVFVGYMVGNIEPHVNADGDGVYEPNILIVRNGTLQLFDMFD